MPETERRRGVMPGAEALVHVEVITRRRASDGAAAALGLGDVAAPAETSIADDCCDLADEWPTS